MDKSNDVRDADTAEQIRKHIERVLHEPPTSIDIGGLAGQVLGGAVGLALYPADADTADDLIKHADADMYARKRAGKSTL